MYVSYCLSVVCVDPAAVEKIEELQDVYLEKRVTGGSEPVVLMDTFQHLLDCQHVQRSLYDGFVEILTLMHWQKRWCWLQLDGGGHCRRNPGSCSRAWEAQVFKRAMPLVPDLFLCVQG